MEERNEILLETFDDLIEMAPSIGICPMAFRTIKSEVERLIEENESMKKG